MKGIFVILDGAPDEPCSKLNDKTPLEYSKTPNLDYFASRGDIYNCFPIAEGIAPQSSSGLVSLFGADFRDYSRGVLESIGAGIHLNEGDLALRINFATIDNLNNMKLIDRRAGRTLTNKEAIELAEAVNSKLKLPFKFELIHTVGHRGVLVFRGVFSDKVTNVDPSYSDGLSVENAGEIVEFSKPKDNSNKSRLTSDLLNTFIRKSYVILENHPINIIRKKKGFFPANFLLCRDAGIGLIKDYKLRGSWIGFGYMPLEIGVAKVFGMRVSSFNMPSMEKEDFYNHVEQNLDRAITKSVEMIQTNSEIIDYFYIHFKETDLPGHDNKPFQKVKFIELIDKKFFGYLRSLSVNFRLLVTSDHTTSCRAKSHTSHSVPVLFYEGDHLKSSNKRFIEKDGLKGKTFMGRQLLRKTLFL
ncbi:MAG: alkaline phosphatase family protein [Nanoarchaeota archaeon]